MQLKTAEESARKGFECLLRGERFQAVKEYTEAATAFAMVSRNCAAQEDKEKYMQISNGYNEAGGILAQNMAVDPVAVAEILGVDGVWKLGKLLRDEDKRW